MEAGVRVAPHADSFSRYTPGWRIVYDEPEGIDPEVNMADESKSRINLKEDQHLLELEPATESLSLAERAAKAMLSPKTIWISLRKPPLVSPKASDNPVTIIMSTATILATGP